MIRKCTYEDISDEELEKIIDPFYDNYHEFVIIYLMPKTMAFYIASSYSRNAMWEATFFRHYNSAKDIFNIDNKDYKKIKREVIKLLRIKYSLEIISEGPLDLKKIEYQVYKDPRPSRNEKPWFFKINYLYSFDNNRQKKSKNFATKKEGQDAEHIFLVTSTNKVEDNNMTFQELYNEFRAHNNKEMRPTTIYGYKNKEKYIECFYKIKVKNFNIMQFMEWKDDIDSKPSSLRTKNDIHKFLKSILNFGVKWYGINFIDVYNKMTKFPLLNLF